MAECFRFVCNHCGHAIESWADGNPYYFDESGRKQYAYHPNHDLLDLCVGNDSPHLCLECGDEFMVDSEAPIAACPKCGEGRWVGTFHLEGKPCPFCDGAGVFERDPNFLAIS